MDSPVNPFQNDVFTPSLDYGKEHVTSINADPAERLLRSLRDRWSPGAMSNSSTARPVMLRSPQAGYGKTHLLGVLKKDLSLSVLFVEVAFPPGSTPSWPALINSTIKGLHTHERSRGGHSGIDEFARLLFARLVRNLIEQGKIPTADRESTLEALKNKPLDVLNFERSQHAVATWFIANFVQLLDLLAAPLVSAGILDTSSARHWLHCLFYYTQRISGDGSSEQRRAAISQLLTAENNSQQGQQRWLEFGGLAALVKPVIVVFDHLDHLYAKQEASASFADLVSNLCNQQRGIVPIISINSDLWESAFATRLPSALIDRLSGTCIDLSGVRAHSAQELVETRLAIGNDQKLNIENFLEFADIPSVYQQEANEAISPRAILRYAKEKWEEFESGETIHLDSPSFDRSQLDFSTEEEDAPSLDSPFSAAEFPGESDSEDESSLTGGLMSQFSSAGGGSRKELIASENSAENLDEDADDESSSAQVGTEDNELPSDEDIDHVASAATPQGEDFPRLDDQPFLRLQNMIADLRADRDEETTSNNPLEPSPDSQEAPPPVPVGKGEAAQLDKGEKTEGRQQTNKFPDELTEPPLFQATGASNPELLAKLDLRTQHHLGAPDGPALWARRLTALASAGGETFPVIRYSEFNLPEANGRQVCKWAFENSEVLFGSEPLSEAHYWDPLLGFAQRRASLRAELLGTPTSEEEHTAFVKLIVFLTEEEQNDQPKWLTRNIDSDQSIVDLVILNHQQQAELAAACDLIEDGTIRGGSDGVISGIANELLWFWNRITRPL